MSDLTEVEACPHGANVRIETGGWAYDAALDLWVHGDEACRRPSVLVLRKAIKARVEAEGALAF